MKKEILQKIICDIKNKKEFKNLDDKFITKIVKKYLTKELEETLEKHEKFERLSLYKQLIKKVRAELRKEYGMFWKKVKSTEPDEVLKSHLSTKERFDCYQKLYEKLWSICGKPKSILDLGCGLNPFSYKYMKLKDVKYYAIELNEDDLKLIKNFFEKEKIKGKTIAMDLTEESNFEKIPKADVALLLKLLDTIDKKKGHQIPKKLLEKIKAKFIIVSFALKTIGQRNMKGKRYRGLWLERFIEEKGWKFQKFEMCDELFYVIKK